MERRPPPSDAWLGVDLGTSSVKALLVDREGTVLAGAREGLALEVPEALAAEQDAGAWWQATARAVRAVLADAPGLAVGAVGLTGQKHALLLLDEACEPLGPAVLWCDGRAQADAREAARRVPRLAARTGAPALPGYVVPKWLRACRVAPEEAARVRHLCFAKDWLRLRLTGALATDPTEASASQLFDARRGTWSADLCRAFDLSPALLPPIVASSGIAGRVDEAGHRATGLPLGTPVVGGAGDNEAGALACGAVREGTVAVILGTSGTVVAPAARRGRVGGLVWGRHALRRGLCATGTVLSAGRALEWFADVAFQGDVLALLEAAELASGDAGAFPLFLPSLAGERSPVPDPTGAGAFLDLRPHHGRAHLARAVVEGVSAALGQVIDAVREAGVSVEELRLTSGGAASAFWCRLIVAAAGTAARTAGAREGPARGAALLGLMADRDAGDLEAVAERFARSGPLETASPLEIARLGSVKDRLARARRRLA